MMRRGLFGVWALMLLACVDPFDPLDGDRTEAYGSGRIVTQARAVSDFSVIDVRDGLRVILDRSGSEHAEVEADDNLLDLVQVEAFNGVLLIQSDPSFRLRPSQPIVVRVDAVHLGSIRASGASFVDAELGSIDGLSVSSSGAARVVTWGEAAELRIQSSGGARYDGLGFLSQHARVNASGGSRTEVWATETLDVTGSGGALIRVRGGPAISAQLSGGATVQPAG